MRLTKKLYPIAILISLILNTTIISQAAQYTYDENGRLINVEYKNEKNSDYTYDKGSNILNVSGIEGEIPVDPPSESKVWNFSSNEFKNLGEIEEKIVISGLTVAPNTKVVNSAKTYDGTTYTHCIQLNNSGTLDSASLSFEVEGDADIYVLAMTTNDERDLLLKDGRWNTIDTAKGVSNDLNKYKLSYSGNGERLYLVSANSAIRIYSIVVETKTVNPPSEIGEDKNWSFSNNEFKSLGEISSTTTTDGLTVIADTGSTVAVREASKTLNGITYTHNLELSGAGNKTKRAIMFEAKPNTDIYITAKSKNNSVRNIALENSMGEIERIALNGDVAVYKYEYKGQADNIYIYAFDDAVNIYSIAVSHHKDSSYDIEKLWNFSNEAFNGLGKINEMVTIDDLTINTGSSVSSVNEVPYTHSLDFSGKGTLNELSASFEVNKDSDIYITARGSGSGRTMLVINEYGYVIAEVELATEAVTYHIPYEGNGDRLYVMSKSSGIKLYDISVNVEIE